MNKYRFSMSVVVSAASEEEALAKVTDAIATTKVRVANGQHISDGPTSVKLEVVDNSTEVDDLRDKREPIEHVQEEEKTSTEPPLVSPIEQPQAGV